MMGSKYWNSSTSNNAKNDSKIKKTTSSAPRLVRYKTVEGTCIEKSWAPLMENIQLIFAAKCAQFREHIEWIQYFEEDWITWSANYCSSNATDHAEGVSHKEAMKHYYKSIGKKHVEKRDHNQQSIENGWTRMNQRYVMLTCKKFKTAYFIAKEELQVTKFERILVLEELHSVELGNAYHNNNSFW